MIYRNLLWDYLGRFSSMGMQILTSIILGWIIDVKLFGLIGLTLAVNNIASTFSNFGFASYIIQQNKEDDELQSTIFWFNLSLGTILCAIIILLSNFIANFYNEPQLKNIIVICSLFLPLNMILQVPTALLSKRLMFKQINLRNIVVAFVSGAVGIASAYNGLGVWSLVIQQSLNIILNILTAYKLASWKPSFVFNKLKFKGAFDFGKYIFLATLVESIYSRLDVFTIGKVFKMTELGYYTRAQSLSGNVIQLSSKSLLSVLFPILSQKKDNKDELKNTYFNFFNHICFVFCILTTFCFVLAEPTFYTFLKPKWAYSAILFKIIILTSVILPLSELMLTFIEARGNSKNYFKADLWKKAVLYPTYIALFVSNNLESYLYTVLFGLIGALFINLYFLNKEITVGYIKSIKILMLHFVPTLIIAFILDKMFITGNNWQYAIIKLVIILFIFFISMQKFPSPTYKLILKKIRKVK